MLRSFLDPTWKANQLVVHKQLFIAWYTDYPITSNVPQYKLVTIQPD